MKRETQPPSDNKAAGKFRNLTLYLNIDLMNKLVLINAAAKVEEAARKSGSAISYSLLPVFVLLMIYVMAVLVVRTEQKERHREGKGGRRKPGRNNNQILQQNATVQNSSPDPIMGGMDAGDVQVVWEEDFEKSIEEMVKQVRNNSALSKNKCVVDRQLWMSNTRSLSPWSYRINHDENRIPVDIPEAKCSCVGCINPFTMQEDRTMTSVLIYTKIPVRRRLCDRVSKKPRKKKRCEPRYRTVVESIAVGCTCIV